MSIKQADLKLGEIGEMEMLNKIRSRWGGDIEKTKDKYAIFDFENADTLIELKSRRIRHNQYDDMMIGANKIVAASKTHKDVYFVFNCSDGVFYWKYDKDTDDVSFRFGGTMRRGYDERCECAFIKTNALIPTGW